MPDTPINVVELFAGVGGFRLGLEAASSRFKTVWANQWEPGAERQYAFECYCAHFGKMDAYVCKDISIAKNSILPHELLVGGFPCQDYSVANKGARGIEGNKGALWWQIDSIVSQYRPQYVLLENVDRLLRSPAKQRGRDFGIMLRCLYQSGYAVEWRVINAADYGQPQRRRRIFVFAFRNDTALFKQLADVSCIKGLKGLHSWCMTSGFFAPSFPLDGHTRTWSETWVDELEYADIPKLSSALNSQFHNTGVMMNGRIYSVDTISSKCAPTSLANIIQEEVTCENYFLNEQDMQRWGYLKGAKDETRRRRDSSTYHFSEGAVPFPDPVNRPARTMLTSEAQVSRSSHIIKDPSSGRLRTLTPIECERLNGFPDNWTNTGMPERVRYFTMGNALVVPLVTIMGKRIIKIVDGQYCFP